MPVAEVHKVSKSFGSVEALRNVSFRVEEGELYGFIGPDGAGKTTLFRILNTLLIPDEGVATVLGMDVVRDFKAIRPKLGYMPGKFSLYQDLSVQENLEFFASVFGTTIDANYEIVKPIYSQLEKFKDRLAGQLSGGMKQKLALSCALIHKPSLLLLDEPTTGVDAVSRKEFWEMLKNLKDQGITIIVSTPYMDEAKLCDRVALIQYGKLMQVDTPEKIVQSFDRPILGLKSQHTYKLLKVLQGYEFTHSAHPFGEFIHYTEKGGNPNLMRLKTHLFDQGIDDAHIQFVDPGIEDSFMALMAEESDHG